MGNRIDVLAFLAQVVEENTTGYRSDFQYDVRMLTQAAQEKDMRDRVFYWMSRPNGTWCVKEREVFLQGSGAHSIWTYYADQPEGIRAYRVTITGTEGRKVMGQVIPLDYKNTERHSTRSAPATAQSARYNMSRIMRQSLPALLWWNTATRRGKSKRLPNQAAPIRSGSRPHPKQRRPWRRCISKYVIW